MTALLTYNLPLLAGAPNGIKKLRELILELAVRGKLVPQDPSDEPASELLQRIAEQKARLVAEGKIKKVKTTNEDLAEISYGIPSTWAVASLGQVVEIVRGITFPASEKSKEPELGRVACLRTANVQDEIEWDDLLYIRESFVSRHDQYVEPHDIVMSMANSRELVGKVALIGAELKQKTTFGGFLGVLRPVLIEPRFVMALLRTPHARSALIDSASQTTNIANVSLAKLRPLPFAIPPLAEQFRIVAKVDELMALCDRLEAQQTDAESAHAQLVQTLLDSLTQASDATDFAANWQRLAEHFHTLLTTEPSIDALKQAFLCLGADGRLVSSAVPADYLALSDVINGDSLNGSSKKPQDSPGAVEILRISAGTGVADFLTDEYEHKWADVTEAEIQKFLLAKDDLLACRFNGNLHYVGAFSLYCGNRGVPQIFPDKLIRFRADRSKASPHYLKYILNAAPARAQIESFCATTVGNIGISAKNLKTIKLRLPSLEEQSNIVNRLDQLMTLCDQLKTRLTQARQLNEQLASTLVERALADDGQPAPVTTDQKAARTLLAAEITHRLHAQRTFGQRKLQKVIYLAEHAARLAVVKGNYLRDAAGPHDRQLMNQVENELCNRQWYECIDRETFGHAYRPLAQAGQHQQAFDSAWSTAERATIKQVIDLMRDWDTDRCEMTVTLYAAWNDFILEGRPVTDEAIVDEVMHSWNDAKLRFDKGEWLAVLTEMKKHKLLIPNGFGQRTTGGMLTLPGV